MEGDGENGGGPVLSDDWRKPLVLKGRTQHSVDILHCELPRPQWLANTESFATHPHGTSCILATALATPRSTNRFSIVSLEIAGTRTKSNVHHERVASGTSPFPARSLDWSRSGHLLMGTTMGRVAHWSLPPSEGQSFNPQKGMTEFVLPKMVQTKEVSVAPGGWAYSSCIETVRVSPSEDRFLVVENAKVSVWNMANNTKPEHVGLKASSGTVLAAEWHPHTRGLIATGGATGGMRLLDTNSKKGGTPWKASNAHAGAVRRVAFSPFVDHWMATGGDDGVVSIWDIRVGPNVGPLLSFSHHQALLLGLSWSPLHAELLTSTGLNGSLRLWSLRHPPEYCLATHTMSSPAIGGAFVRAGEGAPVSACVSASTSGELHTLTLSPIFLENLIVFNSSPDGVAKDIDTCKRLAYFRHLGEAERRIRDFVSRARREKRIAEALQVATLLHHHKVEDVYPNDPREVALEAFKNDVAGCAELLPPHFPYKASGILQDVELNLILEDCAQRRDWKGVVARRREVEKRLLAIDPPVYLDVVRCMARHAWTVGVDFFLATQPKLGELLEMSDDEVASIARQLLGGLVDEQANYPLPKLLGDLKLLRTVSGWLNVPDSVKGIMKAVEKDVGPRNALKLCSLAVLRCYCHCLLYVGDFACLVWVVDTMHHPPSPPTEPLYQLVMSQLEKYELKVERARTGTDGLQGRDFLQTLHHFLSFAVELAVTARRMVQLYSEKVRTPQPPEESLLVRTLKIMIKHSDDHRRGAVARMLQQLNATSAAVRQECKGVIGREAAELAHSIKSVPVGTSLGALARQADAGSEALLADLNSCLPAEQAASVAGSDSV